MTHKIDNIIFNYISGHAFKSPFSKTLKKTFSKNVFQITFFMIKLHAQKGAL